MHNHVTAVMPGSAEAALSVLAFEDARQERISPVRNAHLSIVPAPRNAGLPLGSCVNCHGNGYVLDDGSMTDMIGWPIPCLCTDHIPDSIKALLTGPAGRTAPTSPMAQSAILTAPLSRSGL